MKRIISIDGVALDNPLFSSDEEEVDDFIGERTIAIDGSSILFVQAKGSMTLEVQVSSKTSGWVKKETKDLLFATVDNIVKVVQYDDLSTDNFYYDHTKVPMKIDPLFEGCLWYNVEINFLKG